jgi:hypothetical protein
VRLDAEIRGSARVVYNDVADMLADLATFGVEVVIVRCCMTVQNRVHVQPAGKYAFWDAIHLTENLQHVIIVERKMNTTLYVHVPVRQDGMSLNVDDASHKDHHCEEPDQMLNHSWKASVDVASFLFPRPWRGGMCIEHIHGP